MIWTLLVAGSVERFVRSLDDRRTAARIVEKIASLRLLPFPAGYKKLKGSRNEYRVRVGDFRIVYGVNAETATITIYDVDRRDKVYRRR
jgi:mRNA interferase RelE/StbE